MQIFTFTSGNDTVDAGDLDYDWGDAVDTGQGNDNVTLSAGLIYISGPGNDEISTDGTGGGYALWSATGEVVVNLRDGLVTDGHGGTDTVSGISDVHFNSDFNATVIGADNDEIVFVSSGNHTLDLGGGADTVWYFSNTSDEFEIVHFGRNTVVYNDDYISVLTDVETISFTDTSIDTHFAGSPLTASTSDPLLEFNLSEMSEGWWYAGVYNEPQVIRHDPDRTLVIDINQDGYDDAIVPVTRGYRTGEDTREQFLAFLGGPDGLTYDADLTAQLPYTGGGRRVDTIELADSGQQALVTVATDAVREGETSYDIPWRLGDLTVVAPLPLLDIAPDIVPDGGLLHTGTTGRETAVDAHSMAVGDVNNDGMEDIVVGDGEEVFVLQQTLTGTWDMIRSSFWDSIAWGWDEPAIVGTSSPILLDLHLADLNGDGSDDLVVGWGHDDAYTRVFFNDGSGGFSISESNTLPLAPYGLNSLPLITFSEDFDGDGDLDLLINYSRFEPYYGGDYLQYLENDGNGNFIDASEAAFGDAIDNAVTFSSRLTWAQYWNVADLNGDGHADIIGNDPTTYDSIIAYINNGDGTFQRYDVPVLGQGPTSPLTVGDFDGDGAMEFLSFNAGQSSDGQSLDNSFMVHELSASEFDPDNLFDPLDIPLSDSDVTIGTASNNSMSGNGTGDALFGRAGSDTLKGFGGNDLLVGETGADVLVGGAGNDIVFGGAGADKIWAGSGDQGDDEFNGGLGNDTLGLGAGNDTAFGNEGNDIVFAGDGNDIAYGHNGNDIIWSGAGHDDVYGNSHNDTIGGGLGHDTLIGGGGNDVIYGSNGHDKLNAGLGADAVFGGGGNDTITGGGGSDTLYGGNNNDTFIFGNNHGDDFIGGFSAKGVNKINLSALNLSGVQDISISQSGVDTVIDTGQGTITLWNTSASNISSDVFVF